MRLLFGFILNDEYSGGGFYFLKSFAFWFRLGIFLSFDSVGLGSPGQIYLLLGRVLSPE